MEYLINSVIFNTNRPLNHISEDETELRKTLYTQTFGNKRYELTDHLGNVMAVVTDVKKPGSSGFKPDVVAYSDYFPFGMVVPGRTGGTDYRYGFQGQEMDDEVKGKENSVNYKFRMHDPRVGRFFAVDPLTHEYPFYSPYSFSGNRVIDMVELEGKEPITIKVNHNGDISYIELVSEENVEKVKNAYAFVKSGLGNIRIPAGVVFDGSSGGGNGSIQNRKMKSGDKVTHIDVKDLSDIYGGLNLIKTGKSIKVSSPLDIVKTTKQGLDTGSSLVESIEKNIEDSNKINVQVVDMEKYPPLDEGWGRSLSDEAIEKKDTVINLSDKEKTAKLDIKRKEDVRSGN